MLYCLLLYKNSFAFVSFQFTYQTLYLGAIFERDFKPRIEEFLKNSSLEGYFNLDAISGQLLSLARNLQYFSNVSWIYIHIMTVIIIEMVLCPSIIQRPLHIVHLLSKECDCCCCCCCCCYTGAVITAPFISSALCLILLLHMTRTIQYVLSCQYYVTYVVNSSLMHVVVGVVVYVVSI